MNTKTTLMIFAAAFVAAAADAQVFDVAADFSATNNPNGPWSYGWAASLQSPFTIHTNSGVFTEQPIGLQAWFTDILIHEPSATFNSSATNIEIATATWQPHQFALHPGPAAEVAVLRWTAPAAGNYSIAALFSRVDRLATTDVHVSHNGTNLYFEGLDASRLTAAYTDTRYAEAGDTLDFTVGKGPDTFFGDRTGLALTVTRVPLVTSLRCSQVEFCWNSEPTKMYQVQYRSDLTANSWMNLGAPVSGNGSTNCITDAITQGEPKRFYQVVDSP